jgi:DNA/RNA-binding domain of Phe-tRNA-synthetase-like protein
VAVIHVEGVTVTQEKTAYQHLVRCALDYKEKYRGVPIGEIEGVEYGRRLFRNIGLDPTKHRPASEALLNRAIKDKELYSVNALVDVGNWCALDFLLPTCIYDADNIKGDALLRKGRENETYTGLNNRPVNVQDRYVISDEAGPFGSPMTDSQRTAVNNTTKNSILLIYAPIDYDLDLGEKAVLFAKRTQEVCKGELRQIDLLSG